MNKRAILIGAGLFLAGLLFGTVLNVFLYLKMPDFWEIQNSTHQLRRMHFILEKLDKGETETGKRMLAAEINSDVIELDELRQKKYTFPGVAGEIDEKLMKFKAIRAELPVGYENFSTNQSYQTKLKRADEALARYPDY